MLPFRNIDHAPGLLCEKVVFIVEKCLRPIVSPPMGSILITIEFSKPYRRGIFQRRLFHSALHIRDTHRNERFTIGFGQWIRLPILGTDKLGIRYRFTGLDILYVTFGSDNELFRNHSGSIRNIPAHRARQNRIRIIWHAVR